MSDESQFGSSLIDPLSFCSRQFQQACGELMRTGAANRLNHYFLKRHHPPVKRKSLSRTIVAPATTCRQPTLRWFNNASSRSELSARSRCLPSGTSLSLPRKTFHREHALPFISALMLTCNALPASSFYNFNNASANFMVAAILPPPKIPATPPGDNSNLFLC